MGGGGGGGGGGGVGMLHALSFLEISILKIVLLCEEIICHQKKKKFWFRI